MIVNRYAGKCQSCGSKLSAGQGFAYKNGYKWFSVCNSTACHKRLGISEIQAEVKQTKEISEDGVITMPYDRDAVPLIKSLPGAKWNPDAKQWSVSTLPKDLPRLIEVADQLQLKVPNLLREQLAVGTTASREAVARADAINVNGKTLFEFQKDGVKFLALHDRALLADEMGLGKSVEACVSIPPNERILLICPASLKYNWKNELNLWRPEYKVHICSGKDSFRLPEPNEVVVLNYDILPSFLTPTKDSGKRTMKGKIIKEADLTDEQKALLKQTILICDEFHLAKNYKAARSQKVAQLSRACKTVWVLTGTPLMNRPEDLFGMLSAGDMNPFGSWDKFVRLFNGYKNSWGGYEFGLPDSSVPELMKRVMLRRLKKDVLKDLPPKVYKTIEITDLTKSVVDQLNEITLKAAVQQGLIEEKDTKKYKKNIEEISEKLEISSLPSFEEFSEIRALLAESRIPAMLELVESYEESATPLVVFSAHKKPIHALANREGWAIITGETKNEDRQNIVNDFQNGKLKGIGLTIQAGGVGFTLTRASNALFVDLDWTPGMNIQAEDRLVRIGAKAEHVLFTKLTSSHPLDKHIQNLLEYKMELAYKALEQSLSFKPLRQRPLAQDIELMEETEEELITRINQAEIEATRSYALGKLQSIAGREAAKVSEIPEPELTNERKNLLRQALSYMIGRCDGAREKDGIGFNRPDAAIGHWLHGTGLRDEDELAFRVLERILCRYRRQLKEQFENIWKPDLKG